MTTISTSCTEIIPNLWLGSETDSANTSFINNLSIKTILNCTEEIPFYNKNTTNIRISVRDDLSVDHIILLFNYLPKATELIHKELQKYRPLLVHCREGRQRSCSVICAYLMRYYNLSSTKAIELIQSKRKLAFTPTANFKKALEEWELHLSKRYKEN